MNNTTLKEALKEITIEQQEDIPWIVRLIENPDSPLALPGKISLFDHDCIHVLLNRKTKLSDEAFVIGFTMGNDPKTKPWHVKLFKFVSRYFYPRSYRFSAQDFNYFDLGFSYGRRLKFQVKFIDFYQCQELSVVTLRKQVGIREKHLELMAQIERKYKYSGDKTQRQTQAQKRRKNTYNLVFMTNNLKISSSLFGLGGGVFLALNTSLSGYGFILLACSSSQMLIASILEANNIMIFYSAVLFLCVDLLGVYRWLLA